MKVSVITATYNREATILRTISSIKNQSYKNIQCVIVDGGSKDRTLSSISCMLAPSDILISEPDDGIYDALNKGLKFSNGDIIGFLHSDDLYASEDVISLVVNLFTDNSVDVVYGDASFFSSNNVNKIKRVYKSDLLTRKNLAWGKMPAHPSIFIRKEVYDKVGYFKTNYKIAADYEFLCRLIKFEGIRSLYQPTSFVKMQLGGVSTKGLRSTFLLNKEVLRAIKDNGIYTNLFMLLSKYPKKIMEFLKLS